MAVDLVEARPRDRAWPSSVTRSLWVEALLLAGVAVAWVAIPHHTPVLITALILAAALAMGLQSAAVRDLEVAGISTTYITGTMTSLAADLVAQLRRGKRGDTAVAHRQAPVLLGGVWLVYIVGAQFVAVAFQPLLYYFVALSVSLSEYLRRVTQPAPEARSRPAGRLRRPAPAAG